MPKTTQLTLTLQSKPGVLAKVARALADAGVNITALSAGDRGEAPQQAAHPRPRRGKAGEGSDQHQVRLRDDVGPEWRRRPDGVESGEGAALAALNASPNRRRARSVL